MKITKPGSSPAPKPPPWLGISFVCRNCKCEFTLDSPDDPVTETHHIGLYDAECPSCFYRTRFAIPRKDKEQSPTAELNDGELHASEAEALYLHGQKNLEWRYAGYTSDWNDVPESGMSFNAGRIFRIKQPKPQTP